VDLGASPAVILDILRGLDAAARPTKDITSALRRCLANAPHHPALSLALMEVFGDRFRRQSFADEGPTGTG
jgi:hypothetical protein